MTQILLGNLKFGVVEGLYWMSPAAFVWLTLISVFFEVPEMFRNGGFMIMWNNFGLFFLASILGLGVNCSVWWVSKCCSALTLKIASITRNIGIVLLSPMLLGEFVATSELMCYMVSTGGVMLYQYVRMNPEVAERV